MQSIDAGNAIRRLQELVKEGPGPKPEILNEAITLLHRMGEGEATGYLSEKLAAAHAGFETWLGTGNRQASGGDPQIFRTLLLQDIDRLRKALARGAAGQD